jgi:putative transposase
MGAPNTPWPLINTASWGRQRRRRRSAGQLGSESAIKIKQALGSNVPARENGTTLYVFAVIEHTSRRIRVLGATTHPTTQAARNVVMDLQDAGATVRYLIRDRDSKFTRAFDAVFEAEGIEVVTTGIRVPRMNSIMERWVQPAGTSSSTAP